MTVKIRKKLHIRKREKGAPRGVPLPINMLMIINLRSVADNSHGLLIVDNHEVVATDEVG